MSNQTFPERMKANKAIAGRVCHGCSQLIDLGDDVWNCQVCQESMHAQCRDNIKGCANPACSAKVQMPVSAGAPVTAPVSERMKANKTIAGRTCTNCMQTITLGDDVWNCPKCNETMHFSCHSAMKGCANPTCSLYPNAAPAAAGAIAPAAPAVAATAAAAADEMVDCSACGEKIQKKATKCRFCGELQGAAARAREARVARESAADDNLTGSEIVFGILCSGIGLIMSIIWIIQGKKKGWKLLAISLITAVFWNVIQLGRR